MLEGQTIVITGAGQGIGRAAAARIAELGGRPIMIDVDQSALNEASSVIEGAKAYVCDVSDAGQVEDIFGAIFEEESAVHGLINNAGILRPAMIHKMDPTQWNAVIGVNLTGTFLCTRVVGKHMIARAKAGEEAPGAIVNVSSIAGRRGSFGQINYSASKAGMLACTMSTAREFARYGIRANSICFGLVETRATEKVRTDDKLREKFLSEIPLGRFSTPEEVVEPMCFLLSRGASYITGQHLTVDGGAHIGF